MAGTTRYWRPQSVEEALSLLEGPSTVVIGGGTKFNARPGTERYEVVDLQALGLGGIDQKSEDAVVIGSMTTLQELADDDRVPSVVREAARRQDPSTLRSQATLGGCVASAEFDSELLASLLACDARVEITRRNGQAKIPLKELLAEVPLASGEIITAVSIDPRGRAELARTGRTPADRAIVTAVARQFSGRRWLALAGVGPRPVLVATAATGPVAADETAAVIRRLEPPGDFRGSAEYRRALAAVLSTRVLEAVGG